MQIDFFRAHPPPPAPRPPPPPPRPPELLIIGTPRDCWRKTGELWADKTMRLVRYLCPGDKVPPRLVAVWATPRERLPEEFRRALDGSRVEEWVRS